MDFEVRKKGKHAKIEEFVKEIKEIHEEAKVALRKSHEKMKKYVNRNRKEAVEYKMGDRVLISTKDFTPQMMNRLTKKLIEKYIGPYKIKKIISENVVELKFPVSLRIYLVVNVNRIVLYQKQIEGQKKILPPLVEIEREKEYEIEKIFNR